jgi:uncharacterized protein
MSNFAHIELSTSDPNKAKRFYGSLFGWKFDKMTMPGGVDYFMVKGADQPSIGMMKKPMPDMPDHWLGYVAVPSAPKTVAKARKLGAGVYVESIVVPGVGEWAVLCDPMGAAFGAWAPDQPPRVAKKAKKVVRKAKKAPKRAKKVVRKAPKRAKKVVRKGRKAAKR